MSCDPQKTGGKRCRLLFVDDEALVLQGLRRSLHAMRSQWEMTFAESAEQALDALAKEPFDAIISDMKMPRMDGAQLLEEVKRRYPEVVRIVLSGEASRESLLRSIGPTHQYLSKPCDPEELRLRLLQAFLMRDLLHNPAVLAVVSGLKSIPSLPALYHEIMGELGSENTSLERVAAIVAKDAGMTAKILQLANSAMMGLRSRVTNPTQAVSLIGTEMVRALVLSAHVFSQFEGQEATEACWTALWEHSIAVACLAKRIAVREKCPKALAEESFTAGLLHEIGKLLLLAQMPDEYCQVLTSTLRQPAAVAVAERERLGCTHAELGGYLMSIWGLPHALIFAVTFHDHPCDSGDQRFSSLTAVHAADAIVSAASESCIFHDVEWDGNYMAALNVADREAGWREIYQQAEPAKPEDRAATP